MKRTLLYMMALVLTIAAEAQTLNVKVGNVTYQFPASQTGEMTYQDGETLTIADDTGESDETFDFTWDGEKLCGVMEGTEVYMYPVAQAE